MSVTWIAIIASSAAAYAIKLSGYAVPPRWLRRPAVAGITALLPVALLASLVIVQGVTIGARLAPDARLVGIGVAVLALLARAPFIVVVILAAVATALVRLVA
jgi:hypothetical protein